MFKRVLIANRGAIARRIVRACDALGIESVALYSDADARAPHLSEASQALPLPGNSAQQTYLNAPALLAAVVTSGADAVHPGYGFLAENADFAEAVAAAGARFIGPTPAAMRQLGDKHNARRLLGELGLPVFAGSPPLANIQQARQALADIGPPVLLKPVAGGGGIGMQQVTGAGQLQAAFNRCQRLARAAFADDRIFMERLVTSARHIEIQILADQAGAVGHAYERECSVQRRHQKLIEESPAPGIDPAELTALADRAVAALAKLGYSNLGTVEMLRAPDGDYGLLEVNTRIQVEHAVTEMTTGLDLVAAQIQLADGLPLQQTPVRHGFAMEARVYAEHPQTGHASTGRLHRFDVPSMRHVRIETGYAAGLSVTPYYDPLLLKVIAWAHSRDLARGRLLVALQALRIDGVETNIPMLARILNSQALIEGRYTTDMTAHSVTETAAAEGASRS